MDSESLFQCIKEMVDENKVEFHLGSDYYVNNWLVSDELELDYQPFLNYKKEFYRENKCLPLIFSGGVANKGFADIEWQPYHEETTFLTLLGRINKDSSIIYAAFCVVCPETKKIILKLYNKRNVKIWLNNKLIYISKYNIKTVEDNIIVRLKEGRNYFLIEKSTLSICLKISDYDEEMSVMKRYITEDFVNSLHQSLLIVTDSFIYRKPSIQISVLPKDFTADFSNEIKVSVYKDQNKIAYVQSKLFQGIEIVIDRDVKGKLRIEAETFDRKLSGAEFIFVGEIEKEIKDLTERVSTFSSLQQQVKNDLVCSLRDLHDIYTLQESAAYETRMSFTEDVRTLIDGVENISRTIEKIERGIQYDHVKRRGLIVHSYASQLDNEIQYYYAYIPENYCEEVKHPLLILLKYLHKRFQIPEFIYNEQLKENWNSKNTIILSPAGRGINRYEVAGEVDLLEALNDLKKKYTIDEKRVFLCGFSMGGGACWNLAQKFPHLFPGIIACSSDLNPKYNCNLSNTSIVYLNGEMDRMFDSTGNYSKVESMKQTNSHLIENLLLENTNHVSPYVIFSDTKILDWLAKKEITEVPHRINFKTDNMRHKRSYWVSIEDIEKPSTESWISAEIGEGFIHIFTENVRAIKIYREIFNQFKIRSFIVNGSELKNSFDNEDVFITNIHSNFPQATKFLEEDHLDKNQSGLGLVEIYYGKVAVVFCKENDSFGETLSKKLAGSFSRPIYYGEFREKYAQIPVFGIDKDIPPELRVEHLVLIGSVHNEIIKKILEDPTIDRIIQKSVGQVKRKIDGIFVKVPSVFNQNKKMVLVIVYDHVRMDRYKNEAFMKVKFTPPMYKSDLMRNDALIFSGDGLYTCNFSTDWERAELESNNGATGV